MTKSWKKSCPHSREASHNVNHLNVFLNIKFCASGLLQIQNSIFKLDKTWWLAKHLSYFTFHTLVFMVTIHTFGCSSTYRLSLSCPCQWSQDTYATLTAHISLCWLQEHMLQLWDFIHNLVIHQFWSTQTFYPDVNSSMQLPMLKLSWRMRNNHYHSVDMNGQISLVNSLKGYFHITQVTSKF